MPRVIIAGGRNFDDLVRLTYACRKLLHTAIERHRDGEERLEIVSGAAKGADFLGETFARVHDLGLKRFPADWNKWGKRAGHLRNGETAGYADALIAFWDGESRGTADMIDQAKAVGLEVRVIKYTKDAV